MAGFIEFTDGNFIEFHIGETPRRRCFIEDIVSVRLDGDELDYIPRNFNNIPYNLKLKVQVWRGDMAKFIIENW